MMYDSEISSIMELGNNFDFLGSRTVSVYDHSVVVMVRINQIFHNQ